MNQYDQDYSKINSQDFTQKDLMQYLLHSTQHTATREELQEVKSELKTDTKTLREELQKVKTELKTDIREVKEEIKEVRIEIKEVRTELKTDINKLDTKLDRMQWFLIAGFLGILFKDYIIKIFQ